MDQNRQARVGVDQDRLTANLTTLAILAIVVVLVLHVVLQYGITRCQDALVRRERELPSARLEADVRWYCFASGA